MVCQNCGAQLNNDANFCCKCGTKVILSSSNNSIPHSSQTPEVPKNNSNCNQTSHTIYEVFPAPLGLGKKYIFTENSLIYGNDEYLYSELTSINLVNPPTSFTNGVAQTVVNGKYINLVFDNSQKARFTKMLNYAAEQIDLANGNVKNYKYILQSTNGTKIEIYEDYAILYHLKSGFTNILGNSMQGGASGKVLYFQDFSLKVIAPSTGNIYTLRIDMMDKGNATFITIPVNSQDLNLIESIIAYITEVTSVEQEKSQETVSESWEPIVGSVMKFTLMGKELEVSQSMDAFNSYRLRFRELASDCADNARKEYNKKVQNLVTYLEFFPKIYKYYLDVLIKKSLDILIAEQIWTETQDSFEQKHLADFHMAIDEYTVTLKSIELTVQANRRVVSGVMGLIPNLTGGGFGLKGAVKGIATATAFNIVRDGAEMGLVNSVSNINQAQQAELYNRINPDNLFEIVFVDYWRVFLSLANTFNNNGKNIWWPTDDLTQQANNIFQNLSNPNFPQDKLLEVFIQILKTNPYNIEYHKFMISHFGENDETNAIKNYFGYTSFDNPRVG